MAEEWPSWATEKVEIRDPDPQWPQRACDLIEAIHDRLRPWLDGSVEHVGSTAVPGLPAKPVVDLMAPVTSLQKAHGADSTLAEVGWHLVPPRLDDRPWRRFYVFPEGATRRAHLHLVARTSHHYRDVLAFRDALRSQPALAAAYAEVKREAAAAHPADREAYTTAKSQFIEAVVAARHPG